MLLYDDIRVVWWPQSLEFAKESQVVSLNFILCYSVCLNVKGLTINYKIITRRILPVRQLTWGRTLRTYLLETINETVACGFSDRGNVASPIFEDGAHFSI